MNEREGNALKRAAMDYWYGLLSLFGCPREIWFAYAIKVLESVCYFASVLVLMSFLTNEMGLSDTIAGTVFGLFSASMSFFMLFVGFIADSIGIKRALITGLLVALVGRLAITFTTNPWVVYPGLFALSIGFAYMIPLIAAAVKLFSSKSAQKYAYSWYYVVMNVGSAIAGFSRDSLRKTFVKAASFSLAGVQLVIAPTQMIFLVSVLATLASLLLVVFFVRTEIPDADFGGVTERPTPPISADPDQRKHALTLMKEVASDRLFWVFIAFMFLLVMVKMIFQYNHALYPLYMERIGLDEWTGTLYSINPIIIIALVPVATALTSKMRGYNVIVLGSFVSASSVFFLSLGESIPLIVAFQVALSIGEAFWSPRLYDYTATIAPVGKEASYMALSKVPMFFAKVVAGPATGLLLAGLCPKTGPRNTELMWAIVGATTLLSPFTLLFGRKALDVESRKKEQEAAESAKGE